ncbi:PLP-dependent decarboxylase [Pseudoalteromonas xiamenensis]
MTFLSAPVRETLVSLCHEQETPFFVYDLDRLSQHLQLLTKQDIVKLWYAVKANPLSEIIKCLDQAGFDFDVASSGELEQVLAQGVDATRVLNTGPAKSKRQIQHFLKRGVTTFVAESINQVRWLQEAAVDHHANLRVLLRVQLRWPEGEKNPLGGDTLTPFGLGVEEWQHLNLKDYSHLNFVGLHIFQWGNMLSTDKLASLWQAMVGPLQQLSRRLGMQLDVLDLGGGLGIPYTSDAEHLDWQVLLTALDNIKDAVGVKELWMELGRYAVGECGYYANPVVEQKTNYGVKQLIVSGGVNHLLRPAVTGQAFPCERLRQDDTSFAQFAIHGPLCTALDSLGSHSLPDNTDETDWLVFSQCGAYGFTESMPYFLCHELPAEYVIQQGKVQCVRQAESAQYYLR